MSRLTHLLDTSVHARLQHPVVRQMLRGMGPDSLGRCGVLELEVLYSARDPERARWQLIETFPLVPTHQVDWERAAEVMVLLARAGKHRSVGRYDAVLAAVAERAGLTVLHYDRDFETIASVTGQPVQAVAPFGSL